MALLYVVSNQLTRQVTYHQFWYTGGRGDAIVHSWGPRLGDANRPHRQLVLPDTFRLAQPTDIVVFQQPVDPRLTFVLRCVFYPSGSSPADREAIWACSTRTTNDADSDPALWEWAEWIREPIPPTRVYLANRAVTPLGGFSPDATTTVTVVEGGDVQWQERVAGGRWGTLQRGESLTVEWQDGLMTDFTAMSGSVVLLVDHSYKEAEVVR
jgi:hypothetical protein